MPESPLLIIRRLKSGPISVGQWKRYNGSARSEVSAFGTDPADGGWPDPRGTAAWRLLRHSADAEQHVFVKSLRPATVAAADRGRQWPSQGRLAAAAVGIRQRRSGGPVDEKCRPNG